MDKSLVLLALLILCETCTSFHALGDVRQKPVPCANGQAYWCQNITTASSCGALKHCIQSVWEREIPIEKDKSEVCQICLDMVKQARDQLRSNETQADIKAVLDGSCMLIPVKIVREACLKFMNDFATQVIDTLSSEMNPQVVCSVSGLCNNAKVHQLEKEYNEQKIQERKSQLNCANCYNVMDLIRENMNTPAKLMNIFIEVCSLTGSYSDGCMAFVNEHVNFIDSLLKENGHSKSVCSIAGVCKEVFHNHNKSLVRESLAASAVDVSVLKSRNDLPCDLCTQLVVHLKDILIANTTEQEFKLVLNGLCQQMKAYKDQCLNFVDEYYEVVYSFLLNELDGKFLCQQMGLCPKVGKPHQLIRPLLPFEDKQKDAEEITENKGAYQLPVERLNPFTMVPSSFLSTNGGKDKTLCAMCEYFLHFVQQEITLPSNEKKIREVVMEGCDRLPKTIASECNSFVQTYMDAFIALLANRIDPSQVCPSLGVCPGELIVVEYKDKPTCPLCLLAIDEITRRVKNNTVDEVSQVLDDICMRDVFPNPLLTECAKFVTDYRKSIIDMVLTEFTPQESCVFVELCVAPDLRENAHVPFGNIETNEIISEKYSTSDEENPNTCALCEFILTKIDKELEDKTVEEEIKQAVFKVCTLMPKTLSGECKQFISQYADLIIDLLAQEVNPKEICTYLNLCGKASSFILEPMKKCLLCELMMDGLKTVITNEDVDEDINKKLEKACRYIPQHEQDMCTSIIDQLAPQIEAALRTLPVGPLVCKRIHMCKNEKKHFKPMLGGSNCELGSAYWCRSTITAAACGNIEYCQENVWRGSKPRRSHRKGTIVIKH